MTFNRTPIEITLGKNGVFIGKLGGDQFQVDLSKADVKCSGDIVGKGPSPCQKFLNGIGKGYRMAIAKGRVDLSAQENILHLDEINFPASR